MSDKQPEQMTEAELAEYYYAHRDDPDMAGEQVDYVPPRDAWNALATPERPSGA